jgi:hypothetical protein
VTVDLFGQTTSGAVLSEDGMYRYELRRVWDETRPLCGWGMLNPSVADAKRDDPTVRRCTGFTRVWRIPEIAPDGFGGYVVVNLYGLRASDPAELRGVRSTSILVSTLSPAIYASVPWDPIGPENDLHIRSVAHEVAMFICAWGANPSVGQRSQDVARILQQENPSLKLMCLGTTKDGMPRHPLYVKADVPLIPYTGRQES